MRMVNGLRGAATAAALLALTAGPAFALPNLVVDGTFPSGNFNGWTYTSTANVNSQAVVIATDGVGRPYPSGAYGLAIPNDTLTTGSPDASAGYAAYFSTDTGSQTLSQTLSLAVGSYSIGFDVLVPSNGYGNANDATFTGSIAGTALFSSASVATIGATNGTDTWVTVSSVADVATAGTYTVDFTFAGSASPAKDILVNRVFVTATALPQSGLPVPEPGPAAVLGVGLLALTGLRWRRTAMAAGATLLPHDRS